jgi:hypothetical protein
LLRLLLQPRSGRITTEFQQLGAVETERNSSVVVVETTTKRILSKRLR